jgi:hypothetical protein
VVWEDKAARGRHVVGRRGGSREDEAHRGECESCLTRPCSGTSHVCVCFPMYEMDAKVASLTSGGVASAMARSVLGRRGQGALLRWPAVLAGGRLAWSEVATM